MQVTTLRGILLLKTLLIHYCSDPDEPVMSGSDDEFSDLEQENVGGKLLAYAIHTTYHTCRCIVHC